MILLWVAAAVTAVLLEPFEVRTEIENVTGDGDGSSHVRDMRESIFTVKSHTY